MRELKYRVYIPEFSKYVYFGLNDFDYSDRYLTNDEYPIQQYTGLTDKNGKEIYEGDIIHLKFGELNDNLVVKWDKYMGLKYHNGGWTSLVHVDTHGEVIGNIFEHENLLN